MKRVKIIMLAVILLGTFQFAQAKFPIEFRVEKQAMSTPMSPMEDMFFSYYYFIKPVNISFNGNQLNMYYDNGTTFVKKEVTEVGHETEYDGNKPTLEIFRYTDNENASDTISYIVNYIVNDVQIVLPTKNSKGEYIGYTSYRKFNKDSQLASN
jgi:hypothetical protein